MRSDTARPTPRRFRPAADRRLRLWLILACCCAVPGALFTVARETAWDSVVPGRLWSFPEDHWAHRGFRTEWWYFTGQLACADAPGERFGYQFTLFRIGLLQEAPRLDSDWATGTLIMGHGALTDLGRSLHRFSDLLYREAAGLGRLSRFPEAEIARVAAPPGTARPWTLRFEDDRFELSMSDDARGIDLELSALPEKPPVLQGPGGYSRKGKEPGAASYYYSITRLRSSGRLRFDGRECRVLGRSWMDREFSSGSLAGSQVGWDWFGLQLDDGRDLMLYLMRRADGAVDFRTATLVDTAGTSRFLEPQEWSLAATATWRSPETGAPYPAAWRIEVPGEAIVLKVVPRVADQENRGRIAGSPYYWEGAVAARTEGGEEVGSGYVELTGYGDGSRPPV